MKRSTKFDQFIQIIICTIILLGVTACSNANTPSPLGVVVVLIRHNPPYCPDGDSACEPWWPPEERAKILPPRHSKAEDYEAILNQLINDYYQKATFGNVQYAFRVLANPARSDGWWDAPHSIQEYNLGEDENGDPINFHQDGVDIAYQAIGEELYSYQRLLIIQGFQGRSGQACGASGSPLFEPVPCIYTAGSGSIALLTSWISEDATDELMAAIASHELAHLLGAPDQYNGFLSTWPAMGPWDLMDDDRYFTHFGGWVKFRLGWIPSWTDMPCIVGSCNITAVLDPLEYPGNNILRIPFTLNPFTGYMAECRQMVNHDENLPEAGVLITEVDENRSWQVSWVVSNTKGFSKATLKPGDSYVDPVRKITISNISQGGDKQCTIKVERNGSPAPDPAIGQGLVSESGAYQVSQSPDIWIDSPANGWDVYPSYENWDPTKEHPIPSGFGDPFWVAHENRIGFQITNVGSLPADNVVVDILVRQPARITSPCGGAIRSSTLPILDPPIGSVTVSHLGVGQYFQGYVPWTPTSYEPVEIRVEIRASPSEVSAANNKARETYLHAFQDGSLSASLNLASYGPLVLVLPEECDQEVPFRVTECVPVGIPYPKWQVNPDPINGVLKPGETLAINILARPPAGAPPGFNEIFDMCVLVPVGDTYQAVGRVTFQGRVVDPTQLTCFTPDHALSPGSSVPVTGSLTPAHAGENLALEYRDPGGTASIKTISTDATGGYADQLFPTVEGTWTVQAYWQGDDQHASAQSPACTFTVEAAREATPTFTPEREVNCRSGPGTGYGILAYAAGGVAIPVEGRDSTGQWYLVRLAVGQPCWVGSRNGSLDGDPSSIPIRGAPPLPTPTFTPPPVNCRLFSTQTSCETNPACYWYEIRTIRECRNK